MATGVVMFDKKTAEDYLRRWAHEMAGGEGRANLIARLREAPGGTGDGGRPPGGLFSPQAEKVDQLLKDIRNFDERMARLLISRAVGLTLKDMERNGEGPKTTVHTDLEGALGALRMGLYLRR